MRTRNLCQKRFAGEFKKKSTYTPYSLATVRTWWAAATAPRIDACCLSLARPLPAKYALPPCETWIMMGALTSLSEKHRLYGLITTNCTTYRAASSTALAVDDDVTFCGQGKSNERQKGKIRGDLRWPRYEIFSVNDWHIFAAARSKHTGIANCMCGQVKCEDRGEGGHAPDVPSRTRRVCGHCRQSRRRPGRR